VFDVLNETLFVSLDQILGFDENELEYDQFDQELEMKIIEEQLTESEKHINFTGPVKYEEEDTYGCIQAVTGDDYVELSNHSESMRVKIAAILSMGIKVSWKDTGRSKFVANYAEEWFLMPQCVMTNWDDVNQNIKNIGTYVTLDVPKLKELSAFTIGKDSNETYADRLERLAVRASWLQKGTIQYDWNNLAYMLGCLVLDWTGDEVFPFLYGEDIGCGGPPPWGNLDTCWFSMHHFRRGKVKDSIRGIMQEAVQVFKGTMPHEGMVYMAAARAAMVDTRTAQRVLAPILALRQSGFDRIGMTDIVSTLRGDPLPDQFDQIAIEIDSRDSITGAILASARRRGLIMTELDLRLMLLSIERDKLLYGNRPIKEVLEEYEDQEKNLKKKGFKLLRELIRNIDQFDDEAKNHLQPYTDKGIVKEYYTTRKGYFAIDSSLSYGGMMRIFRKEDVKRQMNVFNARGAMIISKYYGQLSESYFPTYPDEKVNYQELKSWIANIKKGQPFLDIPEGFTTGDVIVLSDLERIARTIEKGSLFLIITDDLGLIKRCKIQAGRYECHARGIPVDETTFQHRSRYYSKIEYLNPKTGGKVKVPQQTVEKWKTEFETPFKTVVVLYDFPNISKKYYGELMGKTSIYPRQYMDLKETIKRRAQGTSYFNFEVFKLKGFLQGLRRGSALAEF